MSDRFVVTGTNIKHPATTPDKEAQQMEPEEERRQNRNATQKDILARAAHLDQGSYGITDWERLRFATDFAFGAKIPERACWQFPMGDLSVGQLLDFFSDHMAEPPSDL